MKRILILGATGHTGVYLTKKLCQLYDEVSFLSRREESDPIVQGLCKSGARYIHGNLAKRWTLWEATEGIDTLISLVHIRESRGCLQACARNNVAHYIQTSSTRALSVFHGHPSVDEVQDSEKHILESDIKTTIIRPTMIYGGKRDNNIQRMMDWFGKHRWALIPGGGENYIQPVFVTDLVEAIANSATAPPAYRILNCGGGDRIKVRDVMEQVCRVRRNSTPKIINAPWNLCEKLASFHAHLTNNWSYLETVDRSLEDRVLSKNDIEVLIGREPLTFEEGLAEKLKLLKGEP